MEEEVPVVEDVMMVPLARAGLLWPHGGDADNICIHLEQHRLARQGLPTRSHHPCLSGRKGAGVVATQTGAAPRPASKQARRTPPMLIIHAGSDNHRATGQRAVSS
ncbi:hypothetical protein ACQY0O_007644 [Thecaphora frezii]